MATTVTRNITVLGAGYVGLATAVALADLGHRVVCADIDEQRVATLRAGRIPIVEDGLQELFTEVVAAGRLGFSSVSDDAVKVADVVFLCVPTPSDGQGRADLSFIEAAAHSIRDALPAGAVVVNKSTVPVGSTKVVEGVLARDDVFVVSNPEFLREGSALHDFSNADRVVIGADNPYAAQMVADLYASLDTRILVTDPASAEMIKYAANAFLATKISFVNAVAATCEAVGADVADVIAGIGSDHRIGPQFLNPGPGWGGSCFPKDTRALVSIAADAGYDFTLLRGVIDVNDDQHRRIVEKIRSAAGGSLRGAKVAAWGLTFKARTDDLRDSPAVTIVRELLAEGAVVQAHDPTVSLPLGPAQAAVLGETAQQLVLCDDPYAAAEGVAVTVVLTEWPQYGDADVDVERLASVMAPFGAVVDARNVLDPDRVGKAGLTYDGVGRR